MKSFFFVRNGITVLLLFLVSPIQGQQQDISVFVSGTEGYKIYRIPSIIRLPNHDLIAFCEGRVNGAGDFGDINIVMKRSSDKGKTWTRIQTIVDNDSLQAGNPAPVVDLTDPAYPNGRIFLFYNTGTHHEGEIREGKGYKQVWYKTSVDDGNTWSDAVDITTAVHRQNKPAINANWNFKEDWRYYANTPGHAMQFENGKFRGRIFVAATHSVGDPKQNFEDYYAHGFYTDDHGKTFRPGNSVPFAGSNESMATELYNGDMMMNSRNQKGDIRARIVSISRDGGESWDTSYFDQQLPDPVCQGSILTIGKKKGKNILAFCNAADTIKRDNLTLRVSFDDGKTWKRNILVDKSPVNSKGDYAAYSDIVKMSNHQIGVLYEKQGYSRIVFTIIDWK